MKNKELASMEKEELKKKLTELRKEMIKFNNQIASGASIKSPSMVRNTKRTIARIIQRLEKEA